MNKIKVLKRDLNLDYTLNGGQAFRWVELKDGWWVGVFEHKIWKLRQDGDYIKFSVKGGDKLSSKDQKEMLKNYFRLEESLPALYEKWSKCDPRFRDISNIFVGVRMLKQDPLEIIFSYICSSNNTISRIKSMVEKLCSFYGSRIEDLDDATYHTFPTVEKLAQPEVEERLKKAAFGYRAKYIREAAVRIVSWGGEDWIKQLKAMTYPEAKKELMKLPGIGAKVADCICLMSLNHLQAIPVDTHVFQLATKYYLPHLKTVKSVTDRVYNEIGDHFRKLYGDYAGWPHCVLFCAELKVFQPRIENAKRQTKSSEKITKKKMKT